VKLQNQSLYYKLSIQEHTKIKQWSYL